MIETFADDFCYVVCKSAATRKKLLGYARKKKIPIENKLHHGSFKQYPTVLWVGKVIAGRKVKNSDAFYESLGQITKETFKEYCDNYYTVKALKML